MLDLESIRREYLLGGLRRNNLLDNPVEQFERWMQDAIASQIPDPTAMCLATVDADLQPHQRLVLLKHLDAQGFVFFTNYNSHKAQDIAQNPRVSLHFPWHMMERQVRVQGQAEKLPLADSLAYFLSRPKDSQLAAWASAQSSRISSRQVLVQQFHAMKEKFLQGDIPLPDFWGGYRVVPERFEFWQGGAQRLHDRFEYRKTPEGLWEIARLAP
jgi:pyridoxamine 5'-phosphate oxidase